MNNQLVVKILGTTNIIKTLYLFIKWILYPQVAVDLANRLVTQIKNGANKQANTIALGYLNEFYSKYLEFGKSDEAILKLNQIIDNRRQTNNKIINALIELRKLRLEIKKLSDDKNDQLIVTKKNFGVSQGKTKGVILNITSIKQPIPNNCIGIFPTSGTKHSAQILKCKGVIFLNGAVTSHGAILAREYKIPAVVSNNLTLSDGKKVTLNGTTGKIETNVDTSK